MEMAGEGVEHGDIRSTASPVMSSAGNTVTSVRHGGETWPLYQHVPKLERFIEAALLAVIFLVATIGNVSLWIIIPSKRSLRTATNAFLLCLSGADLLVCVVNMPVTFLSLVTGRWVMSRGMCMASGFVAMLTFVASVMSLGLISINRYVLICHSARYKSLYGPLRNGFHIAGTWSLSALLSLPPLVGWATYDFLPNQSFCFCRWTASTSYAFFMIGVCFGGPFSVMSFCYIQLLRAYRDSQRRVRGPVRMTGPGQQGMTGPGQQGMTGPGQQGVTGPGQQGMTVPGQQEMTGPGQQGMTVPGQQGMTGPGQQGMTGPGQLAAFVMPTNSTQNNVPRIRVFTVSTGDSCMPGHKRDNDAQSELIASSRSPNSNLLPVPVFANGTACCTSTRCTQECDSGQHPPTTDCSDILEDATVSQLSDSLSPRQPSQSRDFESKAKTTRKQGETRLTISLFIVIIIFVVSWLPFCVTMLLTVAGSSPVQRTADMFTLLLGYANSCYNPIIYGVMNPRFRRGYRDLLCFKCLK